MRQWYDLPERFEYLRTYLERNEAALIELASLAREGADANAMRRIAEPFRSETSTACREVAARHDDAVRLSGFVQAASLSWGSDLWRTSSNQRFWKLWQWAQRIRGMFVGFGALPKHPAADQCFSAYVDPAPRWAQLILPEACEYLRKALAEFEHVGRCPHTQVKALVRGFSADQIEHLRRAYIDIVSRNDSALLTEVRVWYHAALAPYSLGFSAVQGLLVSFGLLASRGTRPFSSRAVRPPEASADWSDVPDEVAPLVEVARDFGGALQRVPPWSVRRRRRLRALANHMSDPTARGVVYEWLRVDRETISKQAANLRLRSVIHALHRAGYLS